MSLTMPFKAQMIVRHIQEAGGRAYLVGGALRDLMLGKAPKDWDFATSLLPAQLLQLFAGAKLIGGSFGTVQVPMDGGGWCQITPCRTEAEYSDGRHPDVVRFVPDILADLARRDFTVNAMAFDGQILLDPFGGQRDVKNKILRCVGNPADRFAEDALRVLRLFRLAAQLGFTAEWNTFSAASDAMPMLGTLPRERVADEVRRTLMSDGPQVLSGLIAKGGLAAYGFNFAPSLVPLADVPRHAICRTWALISMCGANQQEVGQAFGFSRRTMEELAAYTELYRKGPAKDNVAMKMKLRRCKLDYVPVAATFAAVSPAFSAEPAMYASVCANHEPYRLQDLAVNGSMLQFEGIRGRHCGRVLDELLSAVIKNPQLNQTQVLLGLARGLKQLL